MVSKPRSRHLFLTFFSDVADTLKQEATLTKLIVYRSPEHHIVPEDEVQEVALPLNIAVPLSALLKTPRHRNHPRRGDCRPCAPG